MTWMITGFNGMAQHAILLVMLTNRLISKKGDFRRLIFLVGILQVKKKQSLNNLRSTYATKLAQFNQTFKTMMENTKKGMSLRGCRWWIFEGHQFQKMNQQIVKCKI